MKVALFTREYPPDVYGGAGVHVAYLARELAGRVELTVHCEGGERPGALAYQPAAELAGANQALRTMSVDLAMTAAATGTDLVHSHTWYANLGGHLATLLYGVPHVMTVHSLEPLRPWKAEQLGGGYALSSWCERIAVESAAAVIAVSDGMRADVLAAYPALAPERVHVIRNGIDAVEYAPDPGTAVPQAIASRFTIPSGSYSDGQVNTVACDSSWMTSRLGSISGIQITPDRVACRPVTRLVTSAASSGVSGWPASSTSCAPGTRLAAARSSTGTPFCRVIRPTKMTAGRAGSTPWRPSTDVPGSGAYSAVSMPLRMTWIRSGETPTAASASFISAMKRAGPQR